MDTLLRIRLEMGAAAAKFCQAHPDSDPVTAQVAQRLVDLSAKATALLQQQRSGTLAVMSAVDDKAKLRDAVVRDLLALTRMGRQAARQNPAITIHLETPRGQPSDLALLTKAQVNLASATAQKGELAPFGLGDQMIASLTQNLAAFEDCLNRKHDGLGAKVGARAQLKSIARDIVGAVSNLDGVHAIRFKDSPELLAAWKSARNVAWPVKPVSESSPSDPAITPTPITPPASTLSDTPKAA